VINSPVLSWQPSGGLLATVEKLPSQATDVVTFLELNGLKRADFDPKIGNDKIVDIYWNHASDVLTLQTDTSDLYLWTRDNYAWMCKKRIAYDENNGSICSVIWDMDCPYK